MNTPQMTSDDGKVRSVLAEYGGEIAARDVFFRGIRGGFSGSRVWRVTDGTGREFCLKRWPPIGPSRKRLERIHRVLSQLNSSKALTSHPLPSFPVPIPNRRFETLTELDSQFWELTPWLAGSAIEPSRITPPLAAEAMQSLAATHLALDAIARLHPADFRRSGGLAGSEGLLRRWAKLERIALSRKHFVSAIQAMTGETEIRARCEELMRLAFPEVLNLLREISWRSMRLPIQPCLADIWYAHVLFGESKVTGIIDFGSMREDCVATDLARLLRSWYATDEAAIGEALMAYSAVRPLSKAENAAFAAFDRTSRVLSAFQWIEWLAVDQRPFDDWQAIADRLEFVRARLPVRPGEGNPPGFATNP